MWLEILIFYYRNSTAPNMARGGRSAT